MLDNLSSHGTSGSTNIDVTNYEYLALMLINIQEGCKGEPAITTRTTIYNWTVQEGLSPGTNFSLLTQLPPKSILSIQTRLHLSPQSLA
ncbi:MAG: hypothetical protein ACRDF4_11805 [Rhabdochlamydiaceae bacterium]